MRNFQGGFAPRRMFVVIAWGAALLLSGTAQAHHGKTFLLVETYDLPHPQEVYFFSTLDLLRRSGVRTRSVSPALLWGVSPRFAVELHGHASRNRVTATEEHGRDEGDGHAGEDGHTQPILRRFSAAGHGDAEVSTPFRYEATAPALRYRLTSPSSGSAWKFGLAAEYEIAHRSDEPNAWEGRFIAARLNGKSDFTVNLIGTREQGAGTTFGYAVGFRPDLTRRVGWGVEAQGEFKSRGSHEVLVGIYGDVNGRLNLKLGVGAGIGPNSPDLTLRAGVVMRL